MKASLTSGPSKRRLHSLIVDFEGSQLYFQYMCREGIATPPLAIFGRTIDVEELKGVAFGLYQSLSRLSVGQENEDGRPDVAAWGGKLFDRIIPGDLAAKLTSDDASSYLVLYLHPKLVWVPWELLWDGEWFLCERFHTSRLLQKTGKELHAAEQRLQAERSGRGALVVFGDVAGMQATAEKAEIEKTLSSVYGRNVWFYSTQTAADTLEQLKRDYEICHFVGHGAYVEAEPERSGWCFADGTILTCRNIEAVSSQAIFPLLIYANSCDSARSSSNDRQGYVSALYQAFLSQGVPHYIGTIAPIPDEPSRTFASKFYQRLVHGATIGEALAEARQALAQRPGRPIWAYYVHYGDPTYRLVSETTTSGGVIEEVSAPCWRALPEREAMPEPEWAFIGREKELEEARRYLRNLTDGKSSVLFVVGEPGSGKSAFLRTFLREANSAACGPAVAIGSCGVQLGFSDPYLPFKNILIALMRNPTPLRQPHGEAVTVGEALIAELVGSSPQLVDIIRPEFELGSEQWERLCRRLGLSIPQTRPAAAVSDQLAVFDQFARLLRKVARVVPLVLALDNLHWADDSSIGLFFHVGTAVADTPVLLVATYRPDVLTRSSVQHDILKHALSDLRRHGAHTISLDLSLAKDLDRQRIRMFVSEYLNYALPAHRLPIWFVDRLVEHTGGNPLFLGELVSFAREKGHIVERQGRWEAAADLEEAEFPESMGAIIDERIEHLSEELRETLTYASVEGPDFTAQVLASLQQLDEDKVLGRLVDDLNRKYQLVDEQGEQELGPDRILSLFHFRNTSIQQHIYQELGAAQRRRLHKRVGECLEHLYGASRMEIAGQLAAHFRAAREWAKACSYSVEAARRAVRSFAGREAIRHYRVALELWELLSDRDDALKVALLLELGDAYKFVDLFDEAVEIYSQILKLPLDATHPMRAEALNGIGDVHRSRGDYGAALAHYEACDAVAQACGDQRLQIEVSTDLADLFWRLSMDAAASAPDQVAVYQERALERANRVLIEANSIQAWDNLRRVHILLGHFHRNNRRFREAKGHYSTALQLAEDHNLEKDVANCFGELCRLTAQYDEAIKYYNQYLDWALSSGSPRDELVAYDNLGLVYTARGEYEEARDCFDRALELNKPMRYRFGGIVALAVKGLTFELQGALAPAHALYRQALKVAELPLANADLPEAYGWLGKLLYGYNELPAASQFLAKYVECEPTDMEAARSMLEHCRTAGSTVQG